MPHEHRRFAAIVIIFRFNESPVKREEATGRN